MKGSSKEIEVAVWATVQYSSAAAGGQKGEWPQCSIAVLCTGGQQGERPECSVVVLCTGGHIERGLWRLLLSTREKSCESIVVSVYEARAMHYRNTSPQVGKILIF